LSKLSVISLDSCSLPGAKSLGIASPKSSFLSLGSAAPPEANRFFPGVEPKGAEDKVTTLVLTKRSYAMRAAFPPTSFSVSVWRLSSTTTGANTTGAKPVFLRHAGATRLAATCLLFTLAVVMVPKADIPETLSDEANPPTSEIVVEKAASAGEDRSSVIAPVPSIFVQPRTCVHRILPVYSGLLTNSRIFRELFCFFLC
jgi:hypothetical protein